MVQALYQPQGGILASERCIAAHIQAAESHGAEFHAPEKVERWKVDESTGIVTVYTDVDQYTAKKLVLTAGSWMGEICPELEVNAQFLACSAWHCDSVHRCGSKHCKKSTADCWVLDRKDLPKI